MASIQSRIDALEANAPRHTDDAIQRAWLATLSVPELRLLRRVAERQAALPANSPLADLDDGEREQWDSLNRQYEDFRNGSTA